MADIANRARCQRGAITGKERGRARFRDGSVDGVGQQLDVAGDRRRDAIFDAHAQDISAAIDDRDDRIAARRERRSQVEQRLHFVIRRKRQAALELRIHHHRVQLIASELCVRRPLSHEVVMLKCEPNRCDITLTPILAAQDVAVEIKTLVKPA